jgi:nitrite reductase/ring-hydroxylating ferredoxin subunit
MAEADSAPIKRTPFEVTDPERIPTKRYYDEAFYKLETERVWPHAWQMACRVEQIQNVGDYIEYSNLGKSIIVVHTKDGIKAFHNACRHRGVALAKTGEHGNCKTQGFICPFHGWRWNTEGKNTFVYGRHLFDERQLDQQDLGLPECRSEVAIGCVFINYDDDARPLRECIGPLVDRLDAHNVSELRAEWSYGTVLPANWKVAMEAFMEGFHVMRTHPQLHEALGVLYNSMYGSAEAPGLTMVNPNISTAENIEAQIRHMEHLSEGMAGMLHPKELAIAKQLVDVEVPEDPQQGLMMWLGIVQDQISKQLSAKGEPIPDLNSVCVSDPVNAVEFLFPNFFLLPYFSSFSAYRIRPLGPESCIFELWSLTFFPKGEEPAPVMEPIMLPYDSQDFPPIPRQDYENIPRQQIGLHAEGFDFMRLGKNIEGLISNYQRLIDGYIDGQSPEKLAHAQSLLGGNFDGPIKDLGF